jgi:TRAP-type C4-dicarboxylate transport system permease small subunit
MRPTRTRGRFLSGLCALIALGIGIRLMYDGLQTELSAAPALGIVAFLVGLVCFVGGILIGVLLFDSYPRRT